MKTHKLRVNLDAMSMGSVELDGEPVPACYRTIIDARAGELAIATLHLHALDVEYEMDGGIVVQIKCPICDGVITHHHQPLSPAVVLTPDETAATVIAAVGEAAADVSMPIVRRL